MTFEHKSGCIRMREAMVRHQGGWIYPSELTDRNEMLRGRAWNIPKRPGMCVFRDCDNEATHSGLCRKHDAEYRPRCVRCGVELTDDATTRGDVCSRCRHRARRRYR